MARKRCYMYMYIDRYIWKIWNHNIHIELMFSGFTQVYRKLNVADLSKKEEYWRRYGRLCHLMDWMLLPKSSMFLPSFYGYFRGKGIINVKCLISYYYYLYGRTFWWRLMSYGNQLTDLLCKSVDWFPDSVGFCWKVFSCRVYCHFLKYFVDLLKLFLGMIIVVLSKSLLYCYYVLYN